MEGDKIQVCLCHDTSTGAEYVPTMCKERGQMLSETSKSKAASLPLQERVIRKMGLREEKVGLETQSSLEGLGQVCGPWGQVGTDAE